MQAAAQRGGGVSASDRAYQVHFQASKPPEHELHLHFADARLSRCHVVETLHCKIHVEVCLPGHISPILSVAQCPRCPLMCTANHSSAGSHQLKFQVSCRDAEFLMNTYLQLRRC